MNSYFKQSFILKASCGTSYNFYFNNNNGIDCDVFSVNNYIIDTNTIVDKDVLDFSVEIDSKDNIHLVCISTNGCLIYYIYSQGTWLNKRITYLDLKSNIYKYLTLVVNKESIYILCAYSNLISAGVWTIQYISLKPKLEKRNIISITSGRNFSPFYISIDTFDNVHLVYTCMSNKINNIYYTVFNPSVKKWPKYPQKISNCEYNNLEPYLFIDSRENIHIVWNQIQSNKIKIIYKILNYNSTKKNRWKEIGLPFMSENSIHPIVFEDKSSLKLLYNKEGSINQLISNNNGYSWEDNGIVENISPSNLHLVKFSTNDVKDHSKYNISYTYANIEKSIKLLFSDIYIDKNKELEKKASNNIHTNTNVETKCNFISDLPHMIIEKDSEINSEVNTLENKHVSSNLSESIFSNEIQAKVSNNTYENTNITVENNLHNNIISKDSDTKNEVKISEDNLVDNNLPKEMTNIPDIDKSFIISKEPKQESINTINKDTFENISIDKNNPHKNLTDNLDIENQSSSDKVKSENSDKIDEDINIESETNSKNDPTIEDSKSNDDITESENENSENSPVKEEIDELDIENQIISTDEIIALDNDTFENFMCNIKHDIEYILLKSQNLNEVKKQIEKTLHNNTLYLQKEISNKNEYLDILFKNINFLESSLDNYKIENKKFIELLEETKEKYNNNFDNIEKIESYLIQLKEMAENQPNNNSFFRKLLNLFK
ncbi:hypothetical protein CLPU_1c00600 [Gottschalkia purinilytica]|uniref:Uncharacterized protein n=1 Tax=Gottschalkia purinilytica TaxID=1503 RepID=A0A0L0WEP6_GOTPU|nr:hypothetical protein [Gottschalkia purinilytica]KNF09895.1 hypothetical protein CLPU_1c00600 [Gottschalkia purinilytica]